MKAVVCKAFGPPEKLVVEEMEAPVPGPGQVLIDVNAAAVKLRGQLRVGDAIHILGQTTDLHETITSMQVEHESIEEAGPNDDVAINVSNRVREGDRVYVERS